MYAINSSIVDNEVRIWRIHLNRPAAECLRLQTLLSADERDRAARFRFHEHLKRYVVARANLRLILGRELNVAPERLRFEYHANGKPYLAGDPVRFNLSHSGTLALVAVTGSREIGVDLERIRHESDLLDVAEHYFAPAERAALRELPEPDRCLGFFRCWTRKEAYLKARGDGLAMDLQSFTVGLNPGETALLESAEGQGELSRWSLKELNPDPAYAAALAVEGPGSISVRLEELSA